MNHNINDVLRAEDNIENLRKFYEKTKEALKTSSNDLKKYGEQAKIYIAASEFREQKEAEEQVILRRKQKKQQVDDNHETMSVKNVPSLQQEMLNQDLVSYQ